MDQRIALEQNTPNRSGLVTAPYLKCFSPIAPQNTVFYAKVFHIAGFSLQVSAASNHAIIKGADKAIFYRYAPGSTNIDPIGLLPPLPYDLDIVYGDILAIITNDGRPHRRITQNDPLNQAVFTMVEHQVAVILHIDLSKSARK